MGLSDAVVRAGRPRPDFLVVIAATMGGAHVGLLAAAGGTVRASDRTRDQLGTSAISRLC